MSLVGLNDEPLNLVTLDYETSYSKEYTLRNNTMTSYIRDPRFRAHGAALKLGDNPTEWVSHDELPATLASTDWSTTALLCHNTAFDGLILSHHYGHVPAYYLDTMSMSRGWYGINYGSHALNAVAERLGLGSKIAGTLASAMGVEFLSAGQEKAMAEYAIQDVDLTYAIFEQLLEAYPKNELDLIHLTIKAFADPILRVDHALCEEERQVEMELKSELVARVGVPSSQLMSNQKFAKLLEERGVEPPTKTSLRTGKSTFAFAKADLDFQELENDPRVRDLVKARKAIKSTIKETRAQRMIDHSQGGPLPVLMNYCGAHTMRWSAGEKLNMQNLPSGRDGTEPRLRRAVLAPKGHKLVVVDSSQIEARTLAWLAGQDDLLEVFASGGDPYCHMASKIFGREITKADKTERALGKASTLGLGFSMGANKFAYTVRSGMLGPPIDISDEEAQRVVNIYRQSNHKIVQFWHDMNDALRAIIDLPDDAPDFIHNYKGFFKFHNSKILMPNGLWMRYQGLYRNELGDMFYPARSGVARIYGGKLVENIVQSIARSIVAEQAVEIAKHYRIALLVHDEVVMVVPSSEAETALQLGIETMSVPPHWATGLPLGAEGGFDDCYSK